MILQDLDSFVKAAGYPKKISVKQNIFSRLWEAAWPQNRCADKNGKVLVFPGVTVICKGDSR